METALAEWFQDESPGRVLRADGCEVVFHSNFIVWGYWTAMVPADSHYTSWKLLFEGDRPRKFASWTEAAMGVEAHLKHIQDQEKIDLTSGQLRIAGAAFEATKK